MANTTITKLDNGPFLVKGDFELLDAEGNRYETKEQVFLCRCGRTDTMPFCNGNHKKVGFEEASHAK